MSKVTANARAAESDLELEKAQATLLARYAPDTRIRRMRWSQGETQRGIDGEEVR